MKDKQIQTNLSQAVPEWKLKLAYFYTEHSGQIRRGSLFLLFFADIIIVFLLGSILVNYQTGLIRDKAELSTMKDNLVNTQAILKQKPEELVVSQIMAVSANNGRYNLAAQIKNNNSNWAVTQIEYSFKVGGEILDSRTSFILPKSQKYLMYFNAPQGVGAELVILNTKWQRIRDYSLLSFKDGVVVENAVYRPSSSKILSGQTNIRLKNNTPYGFWEIGLPVILTNYSGQAIAINYVLINKLEADESREITISWHEPIKEKVRQVQAIPEINLLNKSVIMEIEAGQSSPPGYE